jgi:hypothetical protein
MERHNPENNATIAKNVINVSLPITLITPINPIPISKLYFSPKKGWEYAVQHGY